MMVNSTPTGCVKPVLTCWFQSIQIFCCTLARYQSPPVSVPVGTPGPGGPNTSPGVAEATDFAGLVPAEPLPAAVVGLVVARTGGGVGGRRVFESGSGSAFGRGSALGGGFN